MAITVGTVAPFQPYSAVGDKSPQLALQFAANISQTFGIGDVVVASTGKASVNNAAGQTGTTIIGVVMNPVTTGGTVTDNDTVTVAAALQSQLFLGSVVGGAATDYTTTFSYSGLCIQDIDMVELTVGGFAALDATDATGPAYILGPAREQLGGKNFGAAAISATNPNPRVIFHFPASVFTATT